MKTLINVLISPVKKSLEKEIYDLAGCNFNIMSPKQLGELLFEKLKLPALSIS